LLTYLEAGILELGFQMIKYEPPVGGRGREKEKGRSG
jgi:hypothetical protein